MLNYAQHLFAYHYAQIMPA